MARAAPPPDGALAAPVSSLQRVAELNEATLTEIRRLADSGGRPAGPIGVPSSTALTLGGSITIGPELEIEAVVVAVLDTTSGSLQPAGPPVALAIVEDSGGDRLPCAIPDGMLHAADPKLWLRENAANVAPAGPTPRIWHLNRTAGSLAEAGSLLRVSATTRADGKTTVMGTLMPVFNDWRSRAAVSNRPIVVSISPLGRSRLDGSFKTGAAHIAVTLALPIPVGGGLDPRFASPGETHLLDDILASAPVREGFARADAARAVTEAACAAVRGHGAQRGAPCDGVQPAALLAELSRNREAYFRLEDSERDRRGATPARCSGSASTGGRHVRPPSSRDELGTMIEGRGCARLGLEVGSFEGSNADALLTRWPSAWAVFLVDPWSMQAGASYDDVLAGTQGHMDAVMEMARAATRLHGPRAVFWRAFGGDAAAVSPEGSLDFVYLDARHDYTSVTEDMEAWWGRMRGGGLLAGHDFLDHGQRRDGNRWDVQPDGSVRADGKAVRGAVEDFARRQGRDVTVTSGPEAYPTWMVKR